MTQTNIFTEDSLVEERFRERDQDIKISERLRERHNGSYIGLILGG